MIKLTTPGGLRAGLVAFFFLASACTGSLETTDGVFLNPERGFYRTLNLVNDRGCDWVRQGGYTLAHSYIRLDDYRDRDLDSALLDAAAGFNRLATVTLDPSAPGSTDPRAERFEAIE
jgi:hypothetical protein